MKNKKGIITHIITIAIIIMVLLPGGIILYKNLKEIGIKRESYKEFCVERPTFCYCDFYGCEFKTSWSSINGLSNETKELCVLAKELNDKKLLFNVGCEA